MHKQDNSKHRQKPELIPYITPQLCSKNCTIYRSINVIKSLCCILSENVNETGGLAAANGFCSLTSNRVCQPR